MPKKSRRAKAKHRAAVAKAVQERYPQQPKPVPTLFRFLPGDLDMHYKVFLAVLAKSNASPKVPV
jgi:hypothetical protein